MPVDDQRRAFHGSRGRSGPGEGVDGRELRELALTRIAVESCEGSRHGLAIRAMVFMGSNYSFAWRRYATERYAFIYGLARLGDLEIEAGAQLHRSRSVVFRARRNSIRF